MSDTPIPGTPEPEHIRALREQAEAGRQAAAAQAASERTIAFLRAGVDPDSDLGAAIVRRLGDNPVTAESVTAARDAVEESLGLRQPPPAPGTDPNTPEGQFAQVQQQLGGSGGAPAPTIPPVDTRTGAERAMEEFEKARSRGLPEEEAREVGINALIIHAQHDDASTKFDEPAWFAERAQHGHGAEFVGLADATLTPNPLPPNSVQLAKAAAASAAERYGPR